MKHLLWPASFRRIGLPLFRPVDGHDVITLVKTLRSVLALNTCSILHILTKKGKGCAFAENDEEKGHGVAPLM